MSETYSNKELGLIKRFILSYVHVEVDLSRAALQDSSVNSQVFEAVRQNGKGDKALEVHSKMTKDSNVNQSYFRALDSNEALYHVVSGFLSNSTFSVKEELHSEPRKRRGIPLESDVNAANIQRFLAPKLADGYRFLTKNDTPEKVINSLVNQSPMRLSMLLEISIDITNKGSAVTELEIAAKEVCLAAATKMMAKGIQPRQTPQDLRKRTPYAGLIELIKESEQLGRDNRKARLQQKKSDSNDRRSGNPDFNDRGGRR